MATGDKSDIMRWAVENRMREMNYFLKRYPPEEHDWRGKVVFSFSYPKHGWIQLAVTCDVHVQGVIVLFSNALNSFPSFERWLEAVAVGKLPVECLVEEEGKGKTFRATQAHQRGFVFEILDGYWNEKESEERPVYLYALVSRRQFLGEFLKCWDDFLKNYYDPVEWEEYGSDLRKLDWSKAREAVGG